MSQAPVVHRLFDGVESQLASALGAMAAGQACDLDGLADRVDALCREALQVDAAGRPAVLARLGRIVETLARLERDFAEVPR
ncbi:MAG: hypothetical protein JNK67_02885 [Alphaproteobacteria bacterium]|nr:hypothetical protein [Alphaproteobacteria bacterium]